MQELFRSIPDAAQSPYALTAYAIAALLIGYGGFRLYQLRAILNSSKGFSNDPAKLKEIIEISTNTKLPTRISGAEWLANNRQQSLFFISLAIIISVTVIAVVAIVISGERKGSGDKPGPKDSTTGDTRAQNEDLVASRKLAATFDVVQPEMKSRSDTAVSYSIRRDASAIAIFPESSYLEAVKTGGTISPVGFNWEPFSWDYPTLDVKVVNNSSETVYFTDAVFRIGLSKEDLRPVPIVIPDNYRRNARHMELLNDGWGPMVDLEVKFTMAPLDPSSSASQLPGNPTDRISVGTVEQSINIDFSESFRKQGVDLGGDAPRMREAGYNAKGDARFGKFKTGAALVAGELEYRCKMDGREVAAKPVHFTTIVYLYNEFLVGLPRPPSREYGVAFEPNGTNYERRVSISQELKPGETDRFTFRMACDRSSFHKFTVALKYNASEAIQSPPIDLELFVSRTGFSFVEKKSGHQTIDTSSAAAAGRKQDREGM